MLDRVHKYRLLCRCRELRFRRLFTVLATCTILMTMGFIVWPVSPVVLDLRSPGSADALSLMEHWRQGDLAVLVRHAERCDRSSNPCLGPADGITQLGSVESQHLGQAFSQMDLSHTDILSSPILRTMQTAHYMFAVPPTSAQWLADCGKTLRDDVIAHKRAGRNLILVTHSGCISDFEKQTGFKHAATSEYTSSLFVTVAANGTVKVIGIANMADWPADMTLNIKR
jgi:phosphohistidine phosphatase SixA